MLFELVAFPTLRRRFSPAAVEPSLKGNRNWLPPAVELSGLPPSVSVGLSVPLIAAIWVLAACGGALVAPSTAWGESFIS
jgi:hypothetical protein